MPDALPPSEFGGKVRLNRTQPSPHEVTPSERLMLTYTTGDETGNSDPDDGEAFSGLLPLDEQAELRQADIDAQGYGSVWEEMTGG